MPMKISCIPRLFSISHSNYNKNKRSSQCDCWRKSKHSKCRYTCEKRRGLTGIYLQSSKQILCGPTPEKQGVPADHRNALFSFLGKSQALIHIKVYAGICVADGLFCREIDGLFCRSSPDIIVRRRCVLSHKRRGWLEPSPSFRYSRNLALQDELYHPVINNGPAVLVCVDKRLGTGPVNQSRDAG